MFFKNGFNKLFTIVTSLFFINCVPNYYVQNKAKVSNIPEEVVKSRSYNYSKNKKEEFIPYKPIKLVNETSVASKKLKEHIKVSNEVAVRSNYKHYSAKAESVLSTAKTFLGTPYRYGGVTRSGIDCSSLVQQSFKPHNISLPRVSRDQARKGKFVSKSKLEKGDLVFFATNGRGKVSHVGIIVDPDGMNSSFIHASSSKGVMISNLNNSYWSKRYLHARRVIKS